MADAVLGRARGDSRTWAVVLSVLITLIGVAAMALPFVAGVTATAIIAWLLIFSGMAHLLFAWRGHTAGAVLWEVLVGLAYGAIGFYLIARPLFGLASLTVVVAAYLFIEGFLEFALAYELRRVHGRGWLLFDGVVSVVLAVMIAATWPFSSAWVIGVLIGVSMFFSGVSRLMYSTGRRDRLLSAQQ